VTRALSEEAADVLSFLQTRILDEPCGDADPLAEEWLDSLAMEELIGFLEDRYRIRFDDDELVAEQFASLESVAALVRRKRAATAR